MEQSKPGNKPRPAGMVRSKRLVLTLNEIEERRIEQVAAMVGKKSIEWVRYIVEREVEKIHNLM